MQMHFGASCRKVRRLSVASNNCFGMLIIVEQNWLKPQLGLTDWTDCDHNRSRLKLHRSGIAQNFLEDYQWY